MNVVPPNAVLVKPEEIILFLRLRRIESTRDSIAVNETKIGGVAMPRPPQTEATLQPNSSSRKATYHSISSETFSKS